MSDLFYSVLFYYSDSFFSVVNHLKHTCFPFSVISLLYDTPVVLILLFAVSAYLVYAGLFFLPLFLKNFDCHFK